MTTEQAIEAINTQMQITAGTLGEDCYTPEYLAELIDECVDAGADRAALVEWFDLD